MTTRTLGVFALGLLVLGCGANDEAELGNLQQALAPVGSDSELVSASFKPEWSTGERVRVSLTLKNSGSVDWTTNTPAFALAALDMGWDWAYTVTPSTVPSGSTQSFDFVVTAPTSPGDFSFIARMRALGLGDFGETIARTARVTQSATPQWGCEYVADSSDVPERLAPNENRTVLITVRNVGQHGWQQGFYLGTEDAPANLWHQTNALLDEPIAPGVNKTWRLALRAPATPGSYRLRREMRDTSASGVGHFRRSNFCVDLPIDVAGVPPLDSAVVSQGFAAAVAPSEAFTATIVLRNTGTQTWLADGSYALNSLNTPANLWGSTLAQVTAPVASGDSASVVLRLTAPATPGSYEQRWQLRKFTGTDAGRFGAIVSASVVVDPSTTPGYGATVVDQQIPLRMTAGKGYSVQLGMRNTGSSAWNGSSFGLLSTNAPKGLWASTLTSLAATETVVPSGTRTFSFKIKAPASAGIYSSSWRMVQSGGVGPFGQIAQLDGIEVTLCGNGLMDAGEMCDDGNLADGDGCSPTCQRLCGNGVIDPGETCDDGNTIAGDGCSPTCQSEQCGNGIIDPGEMCDDGNLADGDGCSPTCQRPCGNGVIDPGEQCDDGNLTNYDGCNSVCVVEILDTCQFADPALEAAVREALLVPEGPIPRALAARWTEFRATSKIRNLSGIECFSGLIYLYLDSTLLDAPVIDLQPLASLSKLSSLYLFNMRFPSLAPIATLKSLWTLSLQSGAVSDVTDLQPLASLSKLSSLSLSNMKFPSLAPIATLKSLRSLGLQSGAISDISALSSLQELRGLGLPGNAITDITPLQGLRHLQNLWISSNQIEDLSPLAGMTELRMLGASDNLISSLYPLGTLPALDTIYLDNNRLSTLAGFPNLPSLRTLVIDRNQIEDLSPLGAVNSQLDYLSLDDNRISDLQPLSRFEHLIGLDISHNNVTDIRPLVPIWNLQDLSISANPIQDFLPLAEIYNLRYVDLSETTFSDLSLLQRELISLVIDEDPIQDLTLMPRFYQLMELSMKNLPVPVTDLDFLRGLTTLETVDLTGNTIRNIEGLSGNSFLRSLTLDSNDIESIGQLTGLINISVLSLAENRITDITPLATLPSLGLLDLDDNGVSDLQPLAELPYLDDLSVRRNTVSDLTPLVALQYLGRLALTGNQITSIAPLSTLNRLRVLDVGSNQISDLTPLSGLPLLSQLDASSNQISSLAALVNNGAFSAGDSGDLTDNPLDCALEASNIATLIGRGVALTTDCH